MPGADTCEGGTCGVGTQGGHGGTQDMQPVRPPFHAPVCPPCVQEGGSAVGWERWGDTP